MIDNDVSDRILDCRRAQQSVIFSTFTYDDGERLCSLRFHPELSHLNFHSTRRPLAGLLMQVIVGQTLRLGAAFLEEVGAIRRIALFECDGFLRHLIGRRRYGGTGDLLI